jgi:hypothetical protein
MATQHVALLSPLTRRELRALDRELDRSHVRCVLATLAYKLGGKFLESVSIDLMDIDSLDIQREIRYERAARNYRQPYRAGRRPD